MVGTEASGLRMSVGVHSCDRRLARVRQWIKYGQEFVSTKIVLLSSILRGFVPSREPEPSESLEGANSKMKILYICACIRRYMASKTNVIERRLKKKKKIDLSLYFGALKDSPLLDKLEADSKRIREMARSRV